VRGYWDMHCWNGLSRAQQARLIEHGNLPWGFVPQGECQRPAECEITTQHDQAPGPRFYCLPCALLYVAALLHGSAIRGPAA